MTEHSYQIQVSTQLGMRSGTLRWTEQDAVLQGTLEFLHHSTPFSGQTAQDGQYTFSGQICTLVSRIDYHAACTRTASGLQGVFHTSSGDFSFTGRPSAD